MKKLIRKYLKRLFRGTVNELISEDYIIRNVRKYLSAGPVAYGENEMAQVYPPYSIYDSVVGEYTYIAQNSNISMTRIGRFCSIGPNFMCGYGVHPTDGISTSPMFYSTVKQNGTTLSSTNKILERKEIVIGNDVFIGMNVTVLDGVVIGDGAVIGAGAVVSKDIPPYAIAIGCPIQIKSYRFNESLRTALLESKWWDLPDEELKMVEHYFWEPEAFIDSLRKRDG